MMRKMLSILKDCGYEKASLAVQKENYAVRMYQKVGFETIDENKEEYIVAMLSADKTRTFAFAIEANNEVIGSIGVFRCDNIHSRTAGMGYYIGEPYWGKGFGTSAVKQTCKYIFEHTDIIRIFAEPFAYNTASCRVLEKAGFQLEGILHSNAVKNGNILDMKMYALIKQ